MIHGKGSSGKTEHHQRKFTGHEARCLYAEAYGIGIRKLSKEDILCSLHTDSRNFHRTANCRLPERKIKDMMEPEGNQCALDHPVKKGSVIPGALHDIPKHINPLL